MTQAIKQRNMQVFIIRADTPLDEARQFIAKNHSVLKLYLLLIEELTPPLKACLDEYGLDYLQPKNFNFNRGERVIKQENLIYTKNAESSSNSQNLGVKIAESRVDSADSARKLLDSANLVDSATHTQKTAESRLDSALDSANVGIKYFKELIRSGVEIDTNSNIMIFNRVNSGAKIRTNKSVFIFGKCDGDVNCRGEYMILSQIANGKILFNGMAITQSMLKYKLNLIAKDGEIGLKISDIFNVK